MQKELPFNKTPIEVVKEYWNRRPCNIRHSPAPVGTKEYFNQVEARKYFVEPHIPGFADFPCWKDKKVLEIGCGIGTDTINFARHGAQVTAVELSEKSLGVARSRVEVFGLQDRISFYQGNAEKLEQFLPEDKFDLVYSFGVIHHSPHPERIINQIQHYVSSGSTVKIMVYHRYSWKAFWILLTYGKGKFWCWQELIARYSEAQTGCPITYAYSRGQARELLESRGFRIIDLRVEHIFPYRIADYKKYRYKKTLYFELMPQAIFRWLERNFGWHLCLTAKA